MNTKIAREYFLKSSLPIEKILDTVLLAGDASSRQYFRMVTKNKNYIVCLYEKANLESMTDFIDVQKIFQENNVNVPTVYDVDLKLGCFILEDLGDMTFLKKLASLKEDRKELSLYKMAVEKILKIGAIDDKRYNHSIFQRAFDVEKLMQEVTFSLDHLVLGLMNYSLKKEDKKTLISSYENICEKISQEKRVLSHRDFHSRNLMLHNDSFFVVDFQDARMGPPQYDLVSLLDDCYYEMSAENKLFCKKHYFDGLSEYSESFEHFLKLYDYVKIQRLFKALGSFGYVYQTKKEVRYLKYIGHGFEKLKKALRNYPNFDELRVLLSKVYYEN